jgi:hypothetical protein
MRFLIIFLFLTSICFAQGTWQYGKVISQEIDMAGKYRVRVLISDGKAEDIIMLKFQKQPTKEEISTESEKICYVLNNPIPKEETVEDLKQEIMRKDKIITDLTSQLLRTK